MFIEREKLFREPFWSYSPEEVFNLLNTTRDGLTEMEAGERLKDFGGNILPEDDRGRRTAILLSQFKSPLILILIGAGLITLFLQDFKDSAFIFAAVLVNITLGFYQENKAEAALAKLKTYIKERARVVRDGNDKEIDVSEIVPGDIVKLTAGTRIPADARLFMVNDLAVNEAILTGESLPVKKSVDVLKKDVGIGDQASMVFGGTLVSEGLGLAIVVRTGVITEFGKIATLVSKKKDEQTPLQRAIKRFSVRAGLALSLAILVLFAAGVSLNFDIYQMFLISVAAAVSAVPEGLPVALTVILAVGVERLARKKGVVRKLLAAEALGSTTVILTDKTGTLTEAKIELTEIISDKRPEDVLQAALLSTDVSIENPESEPDKWRVVGNPLEAALVRAGVKYRTFLPKEKDHKRIIERKPFNSVDKYSAVCVEEESKRRWIYLGAPDVLVAKSKEKEEEKSRLFRKIDDLAYGGSRLLGVLVNEAFWGILAFSDPVRERIGDVIKEIERAGVRTVIATGDHRGTALSVSKKLDMIVGGNQILTGKDLEAMSDKELEDQLPTIRIFARVTPSDKSRITKLYQKRGDVVAVTGDGVNDAPALKGADIGVAVGSGTDVAKEAADLVILDDNFETIVAAISEGRRILENIRKVMVYLLTDVFDELCLIGGALLFSLPMPLTALQILWVNFFDDSFPAVALAFEKESNVLRIPPAELKKRLIDKEMRFLILVIGTMSSIAIFLMYQYYLSLGYPIEIVRTFIFASFAIYSLFLAFSIKSLKRSIFTYNPFNNPYLIGGTLIGAILTVAAIYMPFLQEILDTVSLPAGWWIKVIAFGLANIAIIEFGKFLFRDRKGKSVGP